MKDIDIKNISCLIFGFLSALLVYYYLIKISSILVIPTSKIKKNTCNFI